jgi:hypothetical protein
VNQFWGNGKRSRGFYERLPNIFVDPNHRPSALRIWATTASTMRGHALP